MSVKSCYSLGCKEQPLFACSCSQNVYICKQHSSDHLILEGDHNFTSLVQSVSETQKQKVFQHLNLMMQAINKNIKKLFYFSEKLIDRIIQETNSTNKLLIKERNNIELMIKSLSKYTLINKELLKEAERRNINDSDSVFRIEKFSEAIRNECFIERKYSKMKDDEYAFLFYPTLSNKIDLLDIDTFKKSSLNFPVNDIIFRCGCCKIDDNKYFIYGGYSERPCIICCTVIIIDIKDQLVFKLPSHVPVSEHALCLFNKYIYCFGGRTNKGITSSSERFDLEN